MATTENRYHVTHPTPGLIGTSARKADALAMARREAATMGKDIQVYDVMAKRGAWDTWLVSAAGVVEYLSHKP